MSKMYVVRRKQNRRGSSLRVNVEGAVLEAGCHSSRPTGEFGIGLKGAFCETGGWSVGRNHDW